MFQAKNGLKRQKGFTKAGDLTKNVKHHIGKNAV
jgi:hypothetical protein